MPTLYTRFGLSALLILSACSAHTGSQETKAGGPMRAPGKIIASSPAFMSYKQDLLNLAVDYTAFDTAMKPISRATFLEAFATGDYVPVRLAADTKASYQLYKLPDTSSRDVHNVVRYYGDVYNKHYKREGTAFPAINFSDVNDAVYNKETLKGKTVVLKFWFIRCGACVAEMPRLNELVEEYRNHKDVLFLSMAFDTKVQLRSFLQKTRFLYATIPVPEAYVLDEAKVDVFPTHMILKDGIIQKVPDSAEELVAALHEAVPVK
ncbi:TlpA disulfide reductase family protein [Chitinophaga sp.]|uniref:TlpA family protein disulfide reductase n=1 Tax=Chitinophaga sp. TaxID=1869181 RepID=UPI002F92DDB5